LQRIPPPIQSPKELDHGHPSHDERLYYFTVEDEGILAEAFPKFETEAFCVAYKVMGTEDVFVTTAETKDAMDRHDVAYNLLADEEGARIALLHSPQSKEELADFEDALKALALAHRAIACVCVGVNGDKDLGLAESQGAKDYTYFTAPAGHTFIWRPAERDEAVQFKRRAAGDRGSQWAEHHDLGQRAEELPLATTPGVRA
jgi:hypothetical protein